MNASEINDYAELSKALHLHNYRYHVLDDPIITDGEYDQLLVELREIEAQHPDWVTSHSPSQRIGGDLIDKFEKVVHPGSILSLGNAFDADGIREWLSRISRVDERALGADFTVEPKLDGLSVVLHYRDGVFVQGATRGNGEIGEDITANLRTVRSLPLRIPVASGTTPPPYLVVRGEAFFYLNDFEALNKDQAEKGDKIYVNPRNTASGALRQIDPALTASRPLSIFIYQIVTGEGELPATQWETLNYLRDLGFAVPEAQLCQDIEAVLPWLADWTERRAKLRYEIDGVVVKINEHALFTDLGVVGKDPRAAVAFKFPAQEVTTTLNEILVNVGRTGVLTPYAVLEPVIISGVTVRQATLHNFEFIDDKDIRPGDRVLIKRAGDVIPYVIGPIIGARPKEGLAEYQPPAQCPVCVESVHRPEGEVAYYCINPTCPAQQIRIIEHFVSRGAMDIAGLGIKIVELLIENELVRDSADLYTLEHAAVLALEGFAEKRVDNLLAAIEASKAQPLGRLINALGISGVGEVMADELGDTFGSLDGLANATAEALEAMEGVGPNIAEAVLAWFERPRNKTLIQKFRAANVWPVVETRAPAGPTPLEGMTFVITGTLPSLSRNQAKSLIQDHGGKVTGSVSKKTDYLLAGENAGSKLTKAQDLEVAILSEDGLTALIS